MKKETVETVSQGFLKQISYIGEKAENPFNPFFFGKPFRVRGAFSGHQAYMYFNVHTFVNQMG